MRSQGWTAPGWNTLGTHTIRFAGLSRKYEIAEIEEDWPSWSTSEDASLSACGARVADPNGVQAMAFADGPYWLVGASAGDLALAGRSTHGTSIAAPSFPPVWVLPPISVGSAVACNRARSRNPAQVIPHQSATETT